MVLPITLTLKLAFRHDKEASVHVGFCPNLKIYSQGITYQEAESSLKSAIILFLRQCLKRGILENVLRERGFTDIVNYATVPSGENKSDFGIEEKFDIVENAVFPFCLTGGRV